MLTNLCALVVNKLCCADGMRVSISTNTTNATLQGQFEAYTNATGIAYIDGLILRATPDDCQLVVSMPDYYPQVLLPLIHVNTLANSSILVNVACAHMLTTLKP